MRRVPAAVAAALTACMVGTAVPRAGGPTPGGSILLSVRETAGVTRQGEVVRSGVPLPRSLDIRTTGGLTVVDATGSRIPAEFRVLARWHAALTSDAPIQWLLVSFPATVGAGQSALYRLVYDGSAGPNVPPSRPLTIRSDDQGIHVDTGAATFHLAAAPGSLFDRIAAAGGAEIVSGGALSVTTHQQTADHPVTRRVRLIHAGPLTATIAIEGEFGLPPVGGGRLASARRYLFTAGSPTAIVRHAVTWEGDLCAAAGWGLSCDTDGNLIPEVNGIRLTRVRLGLIPAIPYPRSVAVVGAFDRSDVSTLVGPGSEAAVRQRLRASRHEPRAFERQVDGLVPEAGHLADGGTLTLGTSAGAVAVGLRQMHEYEPQALRMLPDGSVAVDIVDDQAWLGSRQGLFATLGVAVFDAMPPRGAVDAALWAPLNHPLRAWPDASWFASSGAIAELPTGALPPVSAAYDQVVPTVLQDTVTGVARAGLSGLMTHGLFPRYWGTPTGSEIDCGPGADPTPGDTWDDTYWCATWTDYHNAAAVASTWALRSGQVDWLDRIAWPAALRMLHTQIMQCSPDDPWFYCGQAPAGYGGYRFDFNSSHAYFDNLFLYYWLTGDETVVDTLERGASTMRQYLCARRPDDACRPDDPPADEWAGLTGRVASQWLAVFRFVGLASQDASYLDDYVSGLARALTQHYVEASEGGVSYGFWLPRAVSGGAAGGSAETDQLWMASLYDMHNLHRLALDTDNAPVGQPPVSPSAAMAAWARSLARFGPTVWGDGTVAGRWPNALLIRWNGPRIGGALLIVEGSTGGGDPYLWDTGKAALASVIARAARHTESPDLQQLARDLVVRSLTASSEDGSPLGKVQGLFLARLHPAVALVTGGTSGPVFTDDPLQPGRSVIRAVHIAELRLRINELRARHGLGAAVWTDPVLTAGVTTMKAEHVVELREALDEVYAGLGRRPPAYTDLLSTGRTIVGAMHLSELRAAVTAIW